MKFSFIMVSYNEAEYLEQSIISCMSQKLDDYEIIIGDDGSDDGSIELIKKYSEMYPQIIKYSISNRDGIGSVKDIIASLRVSDVIKRSLDMASGEYCVVLSGDDYFYETDFFRNAIEFLDNNSEYVSYVGGFEKVWEDCATMPCHITYPRKTYWARKYVHLSTFVFRKSVYDNGAFLQRFCDDTGLQYSLVFSGRWKYEKTIMFAYRQRQGSIMHTASCLQNHIVEVMILQDVLCKGFLYGASLAKFNYSIRYVFKHRKELSDPRYDKYLINCRGYNKNILEYIYKYDELTCLKKVKFKAWIIECDLLRQYYRLQGYLYTVLTRIVTL